MAKRNFWRDCDAKLDHPKYVPRDWGHGPGTQIMFEVEEQVIQEYIASGDLSSAALALYELDGPGRSQSLPPPYLPTLGTTHLIIAVAQRFENQSRIEELIQFWKRIISGRTRWIVVSERRLADREIQKRPKVILQREANLQEARRCLLEAERLYLEVVIRLGDVAEAERIRAEIQTIESGTSLRPPKSSYAADGRKIDEATFWELMDSRRTFGDLDDWIEDLTARLQAFNPSQIVAFQRMLYRKMKKAYRNDVWAVAYISGRAQTDDAFEYFCAGLVARGRERFEAALQDPLRTAEDLADDDDGECEQLLSVAVDAYANVTSEDLFEKVSVPSFQARGRSWTPDDLPRLFPECFKT